MKRNIQALFIVAFIAAALSVVKAETMEERKQRIMRKYMRERQDIVQSDLGVPENVQDQDDLRVAESERFKEPSLEFKRQESGLTSRPMAPRPAVPVQAERNWWLETAEMEQDPYADPFSSARDSEEESKERWSPWGSRDDESVYAQQQDEQNDTYSGSREGSFISGDAAGQQWNRRRYETYPGNRSAFGMQNDPRYGSSLPGTAYDGYTTRRSATFGENERMPGYYGRQAGGTRGTDADWTLDSGGRYRPSQSTGLLQPSLSPYSVSPGLTSQDQATGYMPYRSSYQIQNARQRRSADNLQPQQTPYMRPNNYQKWKDNNTTWDPSSGNTYLDELMQNQRRN
jgi:hypothetical protein